MVRSLSHVIGDELLRGLGQTLLDGPILHEGNFVFIFISTVQSRFTKEPHMVIMSGAFIIRQKINSAQKLFMDGCGGITFTL